MQTPKFAFPCLLFFCSLSFLSGCKSERAVQPQGPPKPTSALSSHVQIDFFHAAQTGNNTAVQGFLDQGVDVNLRGPDGATPVMEAAYAGHIGTVRLLLNHGADLSAKKKDGASAPTLTVQKDLVELFTDVSALVDAARDGKNDMVKGLIDKGTPINSLDRNGFSALTEASWNGHAETVKLLLDSGANPAIAKPDGASPLALAIGQKHDAVIKLLEEAVAKQADRRSTPALQ